MNLRNVSFLECEAYQLNKYHRMSFLLRTISCVSSLFEIVHSNVRGPINIFHNKIQYFVTFVDDYSRITWFFLWKIVLSYFPWFKWFVLWSKLNLTKKKCILRSDNAKNVCFFYIISLFQRYYSSNILSIYSTQKEIAECKNHHLLEITRVLLCHMHVLRRFWSNAIFSACYLINCIHLHFLGGIFHFSIVFSSSP